MQALEESSHLSAEGITQGQGEATRQRLEILDQKMTDLEARGDIRPATILNLSPFTLSLGGALIDQEIPPCPADKMFSAYTVSKCKHSSVYKGNQEMHDHSIQKRWDVNIYLPVMQLMEFWHYYMEDSKRGGVVVFRGTLEDVKKDKWREHIIEYPYFVFKKNNRYTFYQERLLGELYDESEAVMKKYCMNRIDQATMWSDNPEQRANIQNAERTWHDFALARKWISSSLIWRSAQDNASEKCPRCAQRYVSRTGVCKCSYVYEPFTAYMSGEIDSDHVRMNTLDKTQWAKVKAEMKRREEARA